MILLAETPVKYRDGTVKSLDELGGEARELSPNTPVKSGGSSKPLDEFIQDQIVLAPETPVVDGEDTTTLEDFVEDIVNDDNLVHKTGSETITGLKKFRTEITVADSDDQESVKITPSAITAHDDLDVNATEINLNADTNVDGDLKVTGDLKFPKGEGLRIFNIENPIASTDANDYTEPGVYMCELRSNHPADGYYILIVLGNSSYTRQMAFGMFDNYTYTRYKANNTWYAWKEFQFISQ